MRTPEQTPEQTPEHAPERSNDRPERGTSATLPRRLAWFAGLWLASIALLGAVAYGIRLWLGLG